MLFDAYFDSENAAFILCSNTQRNNIASLTNSTLEQCGKLGFICNELIALFCDITQLPFKLIPLSFSKVGPL